MSYTDCIAWAAGEQDRWWWPDPTGQHYWPDGAPCDESLQAFLHVFGELGYDLAGDDESAGASDVVALFAKDGRVTHACRRVGDGRWTSKLGNLEDISHDLRALEGNEYGRVQTS